MATNTFPSKFAPLIDTILATARSQLTEGMVTGVVYVINSDTGVKVPVETCMPAEASKEISAAMVRLTVKNMQADATVMVSEAWTLSAQDAPRYHEIINQYGSIGEYPDKIEILTFDVQTRDGRWRGRARIETEGRARRIGPLEVIKVDSGCGPNFLSKDDRPG